MNLFDIFEGAIDDLEARRIEDLNTKMDSLQSRARSALDDNDHKLFDALRQEFMKAKAERDSYFKINVDEAPGAETLAHNQATDASNLEALGLAEEELKVSPHDAGAFAALKGKAYDSNPYPKGTPEHLLWSKGHNAMRARKADLDEHGGGGGGPREWHAYVKAHRTDEEEVDEHGGGVNGMKNYIAWRKSANKERGITKAPPPVGKPASGKLPSIPKGSVHSKLDQSRGVVPKAAFGEATGLGSQVKIVKGSYAGQTGRVGELRSGAFKGAPKTYTVDLEDGTSVQLPKEALRLVKNTNEGWQDFNKVEPYYVCLAGKPVKKFDYYEEARRFHDNWKAKLYREGDKEKADKITLMPVLDEKWSQKYKRSIDCSHPKGFSQKAHCAGKKKTNEAHTDDVNFGSTVGKGSWIVYNPETKQIVKRFKTHTAGKSYAKTHDLGFASSEFYFDNVKSKEVADEASMAWASHKPTGPKFGGYLKGTDPAPTEFSKKSFGAESVEMEEGIEGNMTVRSTPLNLRTPKVVAPKLPGNKHSNALKKARAKGVTESTNFAQWAMENGFDNFTSNPAIYESARKAFAEIKKGQKDSNGFTKCWPGHHAQGTKPGKNGGRVRNCVPNEGVEEDCGPIAPHETYYGAMDETEAWQKANRKDKTSGMSKKAVKAYRREHPGSKLQTAVTTKPSKLKKGSKASKRRKSYCSRSKGQMKMHNISCQKTPDKAICKVRRRWNCESQEQFDAMLREAVENNNLQPGQYYIWEVYFDDGSKKRIKVTKDNFDPKAYYAKQNKNVINVEYNWDVHNG